VVWEFLGSLEEVERSVCISPRRMAKAETGDSADIG
jgi:hypothetical protein